MSRPRRRGRAGDDMPIFEVDGLPYIDAAWLEWRIFKDWSRMRRWGQEAHRFSRRSDAEGVATCRSYLAQALAMAYRVEKWRRCLAVTHGALAGRQLGARVEFGPLLRERRLALGMNLRDLAAIAGVDHKTILNVEHARFQPSHRSLERIIAVPELRLTWADIDPALLEEKPASSRKRRNPKTAPPSSAATKRKGRSRRKRRNRRFRS